MGGDYGPLFSQGPSMPPAVRDGHGEGRGGAFEGFVGLNGESLGGGARKEQWVDLSRVEGRRPGRQTVR